MRILIIEDDCLFAEMLRTFVVDKGGTAVLASSLAAAKTLISSSIFEFVLLDNHLPDGDGLDFIPTLRKIAKVPVPIMMITADDNQNVICQAFDKGADDFLVKPLSVDLLWQKLQRMHAIYKKEAQLEEQTKSLAQLLNKQEQEEKLARYVYEHVSSTMQTQTDYIDTYLQSSSAFNGDVFICDTSPNGNQFVILADATGHGLSAAISIIPLVTTIKAMIRKGLSLPHIIHEANTKLCKELPDDKFVTLIGVEVNFNKKTLQLFNGGMPDVVSLHYDKSLKRIPSTSLALGIMEPEDFEPGILTIEIQSIRNLFFFSDGLTEQHNPSGQEFGMKRVMKVLKDWDYKEPLLSLMINHFTVFNEMNELQDDLSICDVQIGALIEQHSIANIFDKSKKSGRVFASVELEGHLIADTDIIGIFDGLMRCVDVVGDLRQKAFTVFAELISNAVDHGVLDLDSTLKTDYAGFAEYFALKEERLAIMEEHHKLSMTFSFEPKVQEMRFSIQDSGTGYNHTLKSDMQDTALSGRGISLINKICKHVDVQLPGNCTSVILKREL